MKRTTLFLVSLIFLLWCSPCEPQEQNNGKWEWKTINEEIKIRIYKKSGKEYWPIPNSLWSYFEFTRLRKAGVPVDKALEWSKPFLKTLP